MNKYTEKYQKIVNKLIKDSFPNLEGKKIILSEIKILNFNYSATTVYFVFLSWIVIHPKSRNYSKESLTALLAHELAHLDLIAKMNLFQKISFAFSWLFTKRGKTNFERDADILAIKKGYGRGLIKFKKEAWKNHPDKQLKEKYVKGYLSIEEAKSYLKNANNFRN